MSDGEIQAWHYATQQSVRLTWAAGKFTTIETAPESPPRDLWVAPPLTDLQVNGYAGVDFQSDGLTLDGLLSATRALRRAGCTRYLATLVTDEWTRLLSRLRHLRELRSQSDELTEAIAGWHIEGPFLSGEPGFCGAHDASLMMDPTADHIRMLRDITGVDPVLLTLAPERPGALAAVAQATALGFKVSLGHTNASMPCLREAAARGAVAFTHLANGCPRELDRHDNILWRVLELPGLQVSLIPDGIHVSPPLFRLIHRALDGHSIFYVSDAMAAAGAPPGRYPLGRLELEVGPDGIVRYPGRTNFAGSALRPIDGVLRAAAMLGCPWQEVWSRFSVQPAKLMGLDSEWRPGSPANFCLLQFTREGHPPDLKVFVNGGMRS